MQPPLNKDGFHPAPVSKSADARCQAAGSVVARVAHAKWHVLAARGDTILTWATVGYAGRGSRTAPMSPNWRPSTRRSQPAPISSTFGWWLETTWCVWRVSARRHPLAVWTLPPA